MLRAGSGTNAYWRPAARTASRPENAAGPARYPSGLTAVLADRPARRDIYDALANKLCYATTGARILLEVAAERRGDRFAFELSVTGGDVLDRAWVMKNGQQVHHEYLGTTEQATLRWADERFSSGDTCYVRVRQMDGQLAWINPLPFAGDAA